MIAAYIISLTCPFTAIMYINETLEMIRILVMVECIKRLTCDWGRPINAHNCGIFCENDASKCGFPSGHMAITAFLVKKSSSPYALIWLCAMAWARMHLECHTAFQVVSGALLGGFF